MREWLRGLTERFAWRSGGKRLGRRSMAWRIGAIIALQAMLLAVLADFAWNPVTEEESPVSRLPIIPQKVSELAPPEPYSALFAPPLRARGLLKPIVVEGAVEPADSVSFRMGRQLIRLRHIAGPFRNAICLDEERRRWSCGLQARVALVNALRTDKAICSPALDAPGEPDAYECRVGSEDLSRIMVRAGWAKSGALSASRFVSETAAAVSASSGLWRGGWTVETAVP